jgi:hypothetical protein
MSLRHRRIALGIALLAYVPVVGWVALVATPGYGLLPWLSILIAPAALAVLALGVLRDTRPARATAWVALAVLGLWFAENVAAIFWHLVGWEQRQGAAFGEAILGAIDQSSPRVPYWLAALFPLCVAGAYLWRSR